MTTRITVTTGNGGLLERNAQQQAAARQAALVKAQADQAAAAGVEQQRQRRIASGLDPATGRPLPSAGSTSRLTRIDQEPAAFRSGNPIFIFSPSNGPQTINEAIVWPSLYKNVRQRGVLTQLISDSQTAIDLLHIPGGLTINKELAEQRLTESIAEIEELPSGFPSGYSTGSLNTEYTIPKNQTKLAKKVEILAEVRTCEPQTNLEPNTSVRASVGIRVRELSFTAIRNDTTNLIGDTPFVGFQVIIGNSIVYTIPGVETESFTPVQIIVEKPLQANPSKVTIKAKDNTYVREAATQQEDLFLQTLLLATTYTVSLGASVSAMMEKDAPRVAFPLIDPALRNVTVTTYL